MLNGLAAWVVGFDGGFGFDNIGDNYTVAKVSLRRGVVVAMAMAMPMAMAPEARVREGRISSFGLGKA